MEIKHKKQWEFFKDKHQAGQLAHAYIFSGERGIGKKDFALKLIEFLGCKFPDFKILKPVNAKDYNFGDGGEIKIIQIREGQNFLNYKAYHGGFKILVIENAESMNSEAQNCLLKTLEEPKGDSLIILISSKPDLLLPTIFSRCQEVKFFRDKNTKENPDKIKREEEILKSFLPVANATLAEKFQYAKSIDFDQQDPVELLEAIQRHYRKIMLNDVDAGNSEAAKKAKNSLREIESIISKLTFTNANPKMALEILLMNI